MDITEQPFPQRPALPAMPVLTQRTLLSYEPVDSIHETCCLEQGGEFEIRIERERQLLSALSRIGELEKEKTQAVVDCLAVKELGDTAVGIGLELAARLQKAEDERDQSQAKLDAYKIARPISEWHDDMGCCLWWIFPLQEPPYVGDPMCDDWPGYHTHFTRLTNDMAPSAAVEGKDAK